MPIIEEVDSGIEAMSASTSRESSPSLKKDETQPKEVVPSVTDDDDDEDIDETLAERLWGLTEMFPESVQNFTYTIVRGSILGMKSFYSLSRSAMWVFFSSSAILMAPIIFEAERMQMEEATKQQQRQILLGPSAAVSGSGMHNIGMPLPPQQMPSSQR